MIYLTTGANGAGKTLLTLKEVREQQLRENRPVYYNGFEALQPIKDFGWLPFDPRKWQDLPDGSICIMDECQNEFPKSKDVPDYINAMAQFRRKRGFDFWMVTPHPMMLHVEIRRLIETPSWHRHITRPMGASMVSEAKYNYVEVQCEKPGKSDSAQVTMKPYPKEVYGWYQSATLHTAKRQIPRAVWVVLGCVIGVPALFYFGVSRLYQNTAGKAPAAAPASKSQPMVSAPAPALVNRAGPLPAMSATEYLAARTPRIPGMPHTAPAFDGVTAPQQAPYPAACLDGVSPRTRQRECVCFTQQATRLTVPAALCQQIASNGFFMEWRAPPPAMTVAQAPVPAQAPAEATPAVFVVPLVGKKVEPPPVDTKRAEDDGAQIRAIRNRAK